MEPNELTSDQTPAKLERSSWANEAWTVVTILAIFSAVEGIFVLRLWSLIHGKVSFAWVVPACAFQGTLISAAISFRRCLRLGPSAEEGKKKREEFEFRLTVLVMMLLLAMMMFSEVTSAYDKLGK